MPRDSASAPQLPRLRPVTPLRHPEALARYDLLCVPFSRASPRSGPQQSHATGIPYDRL